MDKLLEIRGENGHRVVVRVHRYERDTAQNSDDANWLHCSVLAEVGHFRGEVDAAFTTDDFMQLSTQVDEVLRGGCGQAAFHPLEEALTVRIEVDRAGRASVQGVLRDLGGPTLSFGFDSDLSFLRPLRGQLADIVASFPKR